MVYKGQAGLREQSYDQTLGREQSRRHKCCIELRTPGHNQANVVRLVGGSMLSVAFGKEAPRLPRLTARAVTVGA